MDKQKNPLQQAHAQRNEPGKICQTYKGFTEQLKTRDEDSEITGKTDLKENAVRMAVIGYAVTPVEFYTSEIMRKYLENSDKNIVAVALQSAEEDFVVSGNVILSDPYLAADADLSLQNIVDLRQILAIQHNDRGLSALTEDGKELSKSLRTMRANNYVCA